MFLALWIRKKETLFDRGPLREGAGVVGDWGSAGYFDYCYPNGVLLGS